MLIGFAGLGRMGQPMAAHLVSAGHTVLAYDTMPGRWPQGATTVGSAADLAAAPISISMLPDVASTREFVVHGLAGAEPGHLHIVMGTVGPDLVRALAATGPVDLVDAPVSGSVTMAEDRSITAMVGATAEQFDRVQPVLAAMTAMQFHTGPVGTGSVAKLAVNSVLATLSQGVAEGLLLAEAGELDLKVFYGVLRASAAGAPYVGYKEEAFLSPASAGVAAPISLIRKDVDLALQLASDRQLELPGTEATRAVLDEAVAAGLGDEDMAQVLAVLKLRNGTHREVAS